MNLVIKGHVGGPPLGQFTYIVFSWRNRVPGRGCSISKIYRLVSPEERAIKMRRLNERIRIKAKETLEIGGNSYRDGNPEIQRGISKD